jgi:hypothetical protein
MSGLKLSQGKKGRPFLIKDTLRGSMWAPQRKIHLTIARQHFGNSFRIKDRLKCFLFGAVHRSSLPTLAYPVVGVKAGVDFMITIFCDFCQFSAKNGGFLKNECYDQLFSKFSFVLSQKRQFFAEFFRRKYF